MAGVKGKSGGARPGAGRKPAPKAPITVPVAPTPLEFLLAVMNDQMADPALRVKAATTAAQYVHIRKVDGGKKDDQADAAKKASSGKFAAAAPPLKLVGRR